MSKLCIVDVSIVQHFSERDLAWGVMIGGPGEPDTFNFGNRPVPM